MLYVYIYVQELSCVRNRLSVSDVVELPSTDSQEGHSPEGVAPPLTISTTLPSSVLPAYNSRPN